MDAGIPHAGLGIDKRGEDGALMFGMLESDKFKAANIKKQIDNLIDVPYYIEWKAGFDDHHFNCPTTTSECDIVVGGIKSRGEAIPLFNLWSTCSLGLPYLNQTTWGVLMSAHCFNNTLDFDLNQPEKVGEKIGEVTFTHYGGICDCAFATLNTTRAIHAGLYMDNQTIDYVTDFQQPKIGDVVRTIGYNGHEVAEVYDDNYTAFFLVTFQYIYETFRTDNDMYSGASSAPVVLDNDTSTYVGMHIGGHQAQNYSIFVPWNNINQTLNLQ